MPFGLISTVLTRYKADTKDQERAIKKLRGEEKKRAQEALDGLKEQNDKLDRQIAMWGKVAVGVGGAVVAIKAINAAFNTYTRDVQLRSAAAGADIGKLQAATRGLIEEEKLLELAAAGLNTEFALNQEQLEEVGRFMLTLRAQGNDVEEVFQEVKKAVAETNAEGLKKFGVQIQTSAGTLEGFNAIMAEVRDQNERFKDGLELAGDAAVRGGVAARDAWRDARVEFGRLGNITNQVSGALGRAASATARAWGEVTDAIVQLNIQLLIAQGRTKALRDEEDAVVARAREQASKIASGPIYTAGFDSTDFKSRFGDLYKPKSSRGARPITPGGPLSDVGALLKSAASQIDRAGSLASRTGTGLSESIAARNSALDGSLIPTVPGGSSRALEFSGTGSGAEQAGMTESQTKAFQAIVQGSQIAQSAMTGAFTSMIDGSKSFSEAMRDMTGALLKGYAVRMFSRSLMETAEGVAMLFINPAASGSHFAAAGLFAAGAATLGGLASQFGASGAPTGGGGARTSGARLGATPSNTAAGNAAQGGGGTTIIVVPDLDGDKRRRARRLRGLIRESEASSGTRTVTMGS